MSFIHDDFLLQSETSRRLYQTYAASEPILDYHSHLPPADIASDRRFNNLFEPWLEGDHYKWRAMRANGVPETHVHRCRRSAREISGLGAYCSLHAPKPALSLDASRTKALLRHRRIAERKFRAGNLGSRQRTAHFIERSHDPGHPAKIQSPGRLHDGRSLRRSGASSCGQFCCERRAFACIPRFAPTPLWPFGSPKRSLRG